MRNATYSLFFFCAVIWPAGLRAEEAPNDMLIVPDERVGLVTKDVTEVDLLHRLSNAAVQRVLQPEGENTFRCATRIFPNSDRTLTITWKSDPTIYGIDKDGSFLKECQKKPPFFTPQSVVIQEQGPRQIPLWKTANGIGIGSNLNALQIANIASVTFSICQCDFGGDVLNWNQGHFPSAIYIHLDYTNSFPLDTLAPSVREPESGVPSAELSPRIKDRIFVNKIIVGLNK